MKIVRFSKDGVVKYGIQDGDSVIVCEDDPYRGLCPLDIEFNIADVTLLAPCQPSKVVCVGLNYRTHAIETNNPIPETPVIFLKPPTSVIATEEYIVHPPDSNRVDYECELAIVIKQKARMVPLEKAMDYVLGYTCLNDVTARDQQNLDGQWTRAKSHDTFCPIGPVIETDLDPSNVDISTLVNGEVKQSGNTSDLIFPVPEIIRFVTSVMTLLPGDVIATGTPAGIGPIRPGDTVEVKIDPIGTLRNYVKAYE